MTISSNFTFTRGEWGGFGTMDVSSGATLNFNLGQSATNIERGIRNFGTVIVDAGGEVNSKAGV